MQSILNIRKQGSPKTLWVSLFLLGLLVLTFFIGVNYGSVDISLVDIYKIVLYKVLGMELPSTFKASTVDIVWLIRLPRLVLAMCVGMGLSICGIVMQAIVKNPMADPYTLGVSSGASLGATMAIMLGVGTFLGENYVGVAAFIVAFLVSILVITIANFKGKANAIKLLLSGMAISTLCSSISNFIVYISNNREGMRSVTFWLMGSFAGAKWENLVVVIPIVVLAVLFFRTQYRTLNLMLLGDDVALTLGKGLHIYRHVYLLITAVLIGYLVFNSGIIGFVGLIIPHFTRLILGTDHKKIIVPSALIGAILLIWADIFSRIIIKGSELPVGIIISLIGAPCFVYLIVSKSYGFGGQRNA